MLKKENIVTKILPKKSAPPLEKAQCFAPSNIALIKYWGKRDHQLNLPLNASLSISLAHKGATAEISITTQQHHLVINQQPVDPFSHHGQRLIHYLDLFRHTTQHYYQLNLSVNLPFAAGLASSACVFAAIALALNKLHQWQLSSQKLSILARLGSGSAARSIMPGFVEWQQGKKSNGMDSFAKAITIRWPDLCIGLCILDHTEKKVSSREGMQRCIESSPLYCVWPQTANQAIQPLKTAIAEYDFTKLGSIAEHNALTMHATMLSAWPPLLYSNTETIAHMQKIWRLRQDGLPVYFTQDAGPNLKILCLKKDSAEINTQFTNIEWIHPFSEKIYE